MAAQPVDKKNRFANQLKKSLFIIIIHSLIPLVGLIFYVNIGRRETLINQSKKDLLTYTKLTAKDLEEKISNVKNILATLDGLGVFTQDKQKQCDEIAESIIKRYPMFSIIGAADVNGNIYCASKPSDSDINVSDRLYFTEAKSTLVFSSGEFITGKIDKTPGITFGYPLIDSNNQLYGIGISGFTLDYLRSLITNYNLPEGFNITIVDKNGTILARYPYNTDMLGKTDAVDLAINKILSSGNEGSFILKNNPSGKQKAYAYTRIDNTISSGAIYIYIDIPTAFMKQIVNKKLLSDVVLATLAIGLVIAIVLVDWYFYIYKKLIK